MSVFSFIFDFYSNFPGEKGVIGSSFFGVPILYMAVKKTDNPKVIFSYAIHGREYLTAFLALEQIKEFINKGTVGTAYFIPLVNPDGVDIATKSSPLYKANGRGVDLNVNFDASWGTGARNCTKRGTENYIGEKPFSEPESIALRDFTQKIMPSATVSYHLKGEEIYWDFHQKGKLKKDSYSLAKAVQKVTGYKIKRTPDSAGGYKDWCIDKLKIPSITIEVVSDSLSHPITIENLEDVFKVNKGVVEAVINSVRSNAKC